MPAPKGMRVITFPVNPNEAVHIYSDAKRIWLQLRRSIPTQNDIGTPSFKTAISLTRDQAIAIATELLTASTHQQSAPTLSPKPTPASGAAPTGKVEKPSNHGQRWTDAEDKKLIEGFDAQTSIVQLAAVHGWGLGSVQSRLIKLGKLTVDQYRNNLPGA